MKCCEPVVRPVNAKPQNSVFDEFVLCCAGEDSVSMAHVDVERAEASIGPNDRTIAACDRVF